MSASHDEFLSLGLTADTQDLYWIRNSILRELKNALPLFHGEFLDIGCGVQPYRQLVTNTPSRVTRYIGMDLGGQKVKTYSGVPPDLEWNGRTIPLADGSVDCAMATEVLEHCPDPLAVLRESHRVMRPGGVFFLTVPFLWPLHDVPYDEQRYTPFALERLLRDAGFTQAAVKGLGGWDASLAQMLGLWALHRPMSGAKRNLMKRITLPLVRYLLKHDHVPPFHAAPMITGLSATAIRP
jgi:SAM-dependent methyltransferase